jgi:glutathione S-transferase
VGAICYTSPSVSKDRSAEFDSPLATAIREATGADRVASAEMVQSLWSGYGQIWRCHLSGAPYFSVIVKRVRWPGDQRHPRGWNSDIGHRRKARSYEVESAWYQRYAARCSEACRVPRALARARLGEDRLLVLEDLDDAGFSARRNHVSKGEIAACLSWLAHFHASFMGQAPDDLWPTGTYWHLETRPEELAALKDERLRSAAAAIDQRLKATPFQTFVHGDAKLANFCFSPDGERVAAVDFQYVGGGCGMKDVAYFIGSCLDEEECEAREADLLDLYFDRLEEALRRTDRSIDFAALERDWRALYPVAWTDFYRFLQGWSPGHWKIHRYSERLAREVLAEL